MNKKGITQTELVIIIIASVVFIMFLVIVPKLGKNMQDKTDVELCRNSMILHSKVKGVTADLKETGLVCPAPHIEIKESTKKEAYYEIADQLTKCWYKTLGKENRLTVNQKWDKDTCVVCSSFEIYKRGDVNEDIPANEVADYLNTINPKTKRPWIDFLDTNWYGNDNSQFFINVKNIDDIIGSTIKSTRLDELSLSSTKDPKIYYVLFIAFSDYTPLINSIDFESEEWDSQYIEISKSSSDIMFHTFVIPKENVSQLPCRLVNQEDE